ncbi:cadherin domain protein, partial [Oesophagostomum dentatum]
LHPSTVDFALIEGGAVAGRTLAVLTVTDEDGPLLGELTVSKSTDPSPISIESGNDEGVFDLHVQKHFSMLKLAKDAADIDRSEYDLHFIATDGQVPERKRRKTLKVYNEAKLVPSPVVVERDLSATIPEDSPVGSFVAQVHTNSSGCRFALVGAVPFHVDEISGIITTTNELDVNNASAYTLEVMVQLPPPSIQAVMSTVTVTVVDVNDHAPVFVSLPNRLSIAENTQVGSTVLIVKARDEDRGENSRISYHLLTANASQYLSIDKRSGKLTLRKALDFEKIRGFSVEIEACDNGVPKLCTTADVSIAVEDLNDNAPEFHCDVIHSTLPLNSLPGTVVTTVSASDRDSGLAGRVYYALLDAITGFSIDRATGNIKTTENLQAKQYKIRVGAMDGNGVMSSNNATVTLFVTNGTSLRWRESPDTIEVADNSTAGDVLATYTTEPSSNIKTTSSLLSIDSLGKLTLASSIPPNIDQLYALLIASANDVSITKCLQLRVKRNPPAPAFVKKSIALKLARDSPLGMEIIKVDPGVECELKSDCRWLGINSDGVVSVKELIDKSINSVHCILEARDKQGRTDTLKLHLAVETAEKPLHLNATYNLRVKEGTRPGAVLTSLATDPAYIFKTSLDTPIGIFPDGSVYIKREIARTTADVISLPITAKHRLRNNTHSAVVNVYIDDVNNHSPECPKRSHFHIEENSRIGTTVGFLSATDKDIGLNGVLGYRLLDNQDLLHIDIATGKITTATVFDAEAMDRIDFKYEVFDHGTPQNTGICNATVFIVDVNDHAPKFSQLFYTAKVDVNDATDNKTVAAVKAADKDKNDSVKYRLLNYLHLFEINPTSGEVSRKGRLRGDSRFNISIAALDKEGKMTEAFLMVTTNSDNELHPVFDKMAEPLRISSSTLVGSIVGKVRAVAGSHIITYRISSQLFDVDSWGNVILTGQLDPSGTREVVVTASTPFRSSTTLLKIEIAADLLTKTGHFRVEENSVGGIITVLDENYQVLLTVPQTSAFAVRNKQLVLTSPLDHEMSSTYQVLVGNNRYVFEGYCLSMISFPHVFSSVYNWKKVLYSLRFLKQGTDIPP